MKTSFLDKFGSSNKPPKTMDMPRPLQDGSTFGPGKRSLPKDGNQIQGGKPQMKLSLGPLQPTVSGLNRIGRE